MVGWVGSEKGGTRGWEKVARPVVAGSSKLPTEEAGCHAVATADRHYRDG